MANLVETANWEETVNLLSTSDAVMGGADGPPNVQARQLANRTRYLKEHLDAVEEGDLSEAAGLAELVEAYGASQILGSELNANTDDADNDIDFSAGSCLAANGAVLLKSSSTVTKKKDLTWAAGHDAGGLFSGANVSNNGTLHCFRIGTTDGTIDHGFDDNPTCDNLPTGFTYYRRLGSRRLDGSGHLIPMIQTGNLNEYKTFINDAYLTGSTTASLVSLSTPEGIKIKANIIAFCNDNFSLTYQPYGLITNPALEDAAPTHLINNFATRRTSSDFPWTRVDMQVLTNTAHQIRIRFNHALPLFGITTKGWVDDRSV